MSAAPEIAAVAQLREQLWLAGYRPIAVYNLDKRPHGNQWTEAARLDPPADAVAVPQAGILNSGILCDGLRPLDLDIDDPEIAAEVRAIAERLLTRTIVRSRCNSPRILLLYKAADGSPPKRVLSGRHGKIEVLGHGQQFVAYGLHPSGAPLKWFPAEPGPFCRGDVLPRISENQISEFFEAVAPVIGAELPHEKPRRAGAPSAKPTVALSRYAEAALDSACRRITNAPAGEQEITLNGQCFGIGTLAGAGGIPEGFARKALLWAARQMRDHDPRHPWRDGEIEKKVHRAFDHGMNRPRGGRRHAAR